MCRYEEFKAALEGLDPKRQSHSPLPIIYQWQAPIAAAGTKCASWLGSRSGAGCEHHVRERVGTRVKLHYL